MAKLIVISVKSGKNLSLRRSILLDAIQTIRSRYWIASSQKSTRTSSAAATAVLCCAIYVRSTARFFAVSALPIVSDGDEITTGSTRLVFVDKQKVDDAVSGRVTIAPGLTESHIRGRVQANTGDFLPEKQLSDEKILRRDYERLRIGQELARAVGGELDLDKLLPRS